MRLTQKSDFLKISGKFNIEMWREKAGYLFHMNISYFFPPTSKVKIILEKLHLEMWRDRGKAVWSSLGKFPTDGGQRSGASLMERNIAKLIKTNYWLERLNVGFLKNMLQIYENNSSLLLFSAQNTLGLEHWCHEIVWILDSEAGLSCIYLSERDSLCVKRINSLRKEKIA